MSSQGNRLLERVLDPLLGREHARECVLLVFIPRL
jgi:hypothetical protein